MYYTKNATHFVMKMVNINHHHQQNNKLNETYSPAYILTSVLGTSFYMSIKALAAKVISCEMKRNTFSCTFNPFFFSSLSILQLPFFNQTQHGSFSDGTWHIHTNLILFPVNQMIISDVKCKRLNYKWTANVRRQIFDSSNWNILSRKSKNNT